MTIGHGLVLGAIVLTGSLGLLSLGFALAGLWRSSASGLRPPAALALLAPGPACCLGVLRASGPLTRSLSGERAVVVHRTITLWFLDGPDRASSCIDEAFCCHASLEPPPAPPPPERPAGYRADPGAEPAPPAPVVLDVTGMLPLASSRRFTFTPSGLQERHPDLWRRIERRLPGGVRIDRVEITELALLDDAHAIVAGMASREGPRLRLSGALGRPLLVSTLSFGETRRALRGPALELLAVALLALLSCASLLALARTAP